MAYNKRRIGIVFEEKAADYLQKNQYQIIERNYYCRQGEIDIIARDGKYLVFVEVKYRKNSKAGLPEEAVIPAKRYRIISAAKYYLYQKGYSEDTPCRFDVIGFCGDHIRLYRNAFEV